MEIDLITCYMDHGTIWLVSVRRNPTCTLDSEWTAINTYMATYHNRKLRNCRLGYSLPVSLLLAPDIGMVLMFGGVAGRLLNVDMGMC